MRSDTAERFAEDALLYSDACGLVPTADCSRIRLRILPRIDASPVNLTRLGMYDNGQLC